MGILGASKMITGTQVVNKSRFDLREFEDFSGVFIEGGLGGSASFQVVNQVFLSLSYDYSKSFRVGEQSPDRLRFNNQRIVFGIHFKLD
jgi:opacity protein-like surface antigen